MTLDELRTGMTNLRADQRSARDAVELAFLSLSQSDGGADAGILRENVISARQHILDLRAREVGAFAGQIDPRQFVPQLNGAIPILLLPLRIQTRFDRDASLLLARVYPDEISIESHEPRLTPGEQDAGNQLWAAPDVSPDPATPSKRDRWRGIVARFGLNRAAWIYHATNPAGPPPAVIDQPLTVPAAWTLPERLVFRFYGSSDLLLSEILGAPIPDGLELGIDPARPGSAFQRTDGNLQYPREFQWQIDFAEAVKVGMGISVPLNLIGNPGRIERLVVLGVRLSTDETQSAALVEKLIASHTYTDGFSILRQGTPTNITNDSDMPAPPDADAAFDWLTGPGAYDDAGKATLYENECDGLRLAHAVGLSPEALRYVAGADYGDGREAIAMKRALWAGTLGYFVQQMLDPALTAVGDPIRPERLTLAARFYFTHFVFGRGPLPAVRAGAQPYGILPVSADMTRAGQPSASWGDTFLDNFVTTLHGKMLILSPAWLNLIPQLPAAGAGANANARLLDVLASQASSVEFHGERLVGEQYRINYVTLQQPFAPKVDPLAPLITERSNAIDAAFPGLFPLIPRVLFLSFFGGYWSWMVDQLGKEIKQLERNLSLELTGDVIDNLPFSELRPIDASYPNYVAWMAAGSFADVRRGLLRANADGSSSSVTALLYMVLRHSLLYEHAYTAMRFYRGNRALPGGAGTYQWSDFAEKDIYNLNYVFDTTYWDLLELPDQAGWNFLGAAAPVTGSVLNVIQNRDALHDASQWKTYLGDIDEAYRAIQLLAPLPTARLERLFAEHCDLTSYRLDAWLTGYVYQRLLAARVWPLEKRIGTSPLRPAPGELPLLRYDLNYRPLGPYSAGVYLGAYGWVEAIEPDQLPDAVHDLPAELTPQNGGPVTRDGGNFGLVHAPSVNHAITAALLRSAATTQPDTNAYNVDLSSVRVRNALWVIEGVRSGQSPAALLGYQFERALRDTDPTLQKLLPPLRLVFPLPRQPDTDPGPNLAIPPHDVVNGLRIAQAARDGSFAGMVAAIGDPVMLGGIAATILDSLDACGDLMIAESAHQAAQGNYDRAGGIVTAAGEFQHVPERFDVVETPRSGIALTHRLLLAMDPPDPAEPGAAPRASLEPGLDRWIGGLLGPLGGVTVNVTYAFTEDGKDAADTFPVTLDQLRLGPIDLLFATDDNVASDFNRRLDLAARPAFDAAHPAAGINGVAVDTSSAAVVLAMLDALRPLMRAARPAGMRDLAPPSALHGLTLAQLDGIDEDELILRVLGVTRADPGARDAASLWAVFDATLAAFDAIDGMDAAALAELLLRAAAFGIPEAVPALPATSDPAIRAAALTDQARRVAAVLVSRKNAALEKWTPFAAPAKDVLRVCREVVEAILGGAFPLMPHVNLWNPLSAAALPAGAPSPDQSADWLFQVGFVREDARKLLEARALARELAGGLPDLQVFQWPADQKNWIGAATPDGVTLSGDLVSLVVQPAGPISPAAALTTALILDEWSEMIPNPLQTTAISFNYDAPNAEPPQALLLAVSQRQTNNNLRWTWEELTGCVEQALTLAKMRAAGPDELRRTLLDAILPATLLAETAAPVTISTSLAGNAVETVAEAANKTTVDL